MQSLPAPDGAAHAHVPDGTAHAHAQAQAHAHVPDGDDATAGGPALRDVAWGRWTRERVALAALGLGTAAILPGALNRFVFPKLAVVLAGVIIAYWCVPRGRLPRLAVSLLSTAGLLLGAAALSGSAPVAQLLGRPPRYEGLIALAVYAGALGAGARLLGPLRPAGAVPWMLDCLAAAALVIAAEAVLETAGIGALVSDVARPGSLLGNASDEGAWALLVLGPLGCAALCERRPLPCAGALGAALTLVCSGSRGALLGACALAVVMLVLVPRSVRPLALACAALIVAGALALPATRARVFDQSPHSVQSLTGHRLLASETLALIAGQPLTGVGPSGFVDAIPAEHDRRWQQQIGPAAPPDSPENWLLQAASSGGLGLLALALALVALTFARGRRTVDATRGGPDRAALAGMLAGLSGYTVALLAHFTSPGTTPLAAVYAGAMLATVPGPLWRAGAMLAGAPGSVALAAGARRRRRTTTPVDAAAARRPVRLGATLAASVLLVTLIAAAVAELPLRAALVHASRGELAGAQRDFTLAQRLRPWDASIAADATHAYAVLVQDGFPAATRPGLRWAARERAAWPDSVQGLSDMATLERAAGAYTAARRDIARAAALDPSDPTLRTDAPAVGS